jgi:hypothetical protein
MPKQYTRLVRADSYDFLNTTNETYQGYGTPQTVDSYQTDPVQDGMGPTLKKDETDPLAIHEIIQEIFFDYYGTNIPKKKISEVVEALPKDLPNDADELSAVVSAVFRELKCFNWVEKEIVEDDDETPQDIVDDVNSLTDEGYLEDIEDDQTDEALNEIEDEEQGSPVEKRDLNELFAEAVRIRNSSHDSSSFASERHARRSLADARETVQLDGEIGITSTYSEIISNPTIAAFDTGAPDRDGPKRVSAGATGDPLQGSWFGGVQSGQFATDGEGFAIINCDNL